MRKNEIIIGRNEVLAKVIFSQACVMNSVHTGGGCLLQIFGFSGGGVSAPNFRGGLVPGGCLQFSEYGQRSAGMHPTGMRSYL